MIVRKYEMEENSQTYCEFWVKDGKINVMVSSDGDNFITEIDHNDADDLRNWLYDAVKQIEPKKEL